MLTYQTDFLLQGALDNKHIMNPKSFLPESHAESLTREWDFFVKMAKAITRTGIEKGHDDYMNMPRKLFRLKNAIHSKTSQGYQQMVLVPRATAWLYCN